MPIYIRFEHNKQVETTTLESKPIGNDWYEAPKNFDWQKSYQLTEGGEIAQRSQEDIELELYQYSLLGKQMGRVINLLNSPIIGKKSSFAFVSLLTGLGITTKCEVFCTF